MGITEPPSDAQLMTWIKNAFFGDDGAPRNDAGWYSMSLWMNNIMAKFPSLGLEANPYSSSNGDYELLVVEGMSHISPEERIAQIVDVAQRADRSLTEWVPNEVQAIGVDLHPQAMSNLKRVAEKWMLDSIRREIDRECRAAVEMAVGGRRLKATKSNPKDRRAQRGVGGRGRGWGLHQDKEEQPHQEEEDEGEDEEGREREEG